MQIRVRSTISNISSRDNIKFSWKTLGSSIFEFLETQYAYIHALKQMLTMENKWNCRTTIVCCVVVPVQEALFRILLSQEKWKYLIECWTAFRDKKLETHVAPLRCTLKEVQYKLKTDFRV